MASTRVQGQYRQEGPLSWRSKEAASLWEEPLGTHVEDAAHTLKPGLTAWAHCLGRRALRLAYCSAVPVVEFFIIDKMTVYEVFQDYRKNLKFLEEIICVVTICIK